MLRSGRRLSLLLLVASLFVPPGAAQEIPSALPSIGRPLDIRDIKNITAPKGRTVITASHVYEIATKFFDGQGSRRDLPLAQAIRRQSLPLFASHGLADRWNVGAGTTLHNEVERKLSALNFVNGATLLGQLLPANQVTTLEAQGDGLGDLNLLIQYQPRWFDDRLTSLVSLDVVVPTADSNPENGLDIPVGQGFWTYRLSYSALREIYPMNYFLKASYEENRSGSGTTSAGAPVAFNNGDGFDYTLGASYGIGESLSIQGLLVGSWKNEGSRSDRPAASPHTRSLHFRPGYTFSLGDLTLTQQLAIPLSGRNVLSTNGVLTTLEYRF